MCIPLLQNSESNGKEPSKPKLVEIITAVATKKKDPSLKKGELMLSNQDAMEVRWTDFLSQFAILKVYPQTWWKAVF